MANLIRNRQIVDKPSPPDLVLEPTDDPALLAGALAAVRVIAVNFPKFGDGRGYSIARLLRERYGYQGELRAVGEVARDHLHAMAQCGFDAFELREGEDAAGGAGRLRRFQRRLPGDGAHGRGRCFAAVAPAGGMSARCTSSAPAPARRICSRCAPRGCSSAPTSCSTTRWCPRNRSRSPCAPIKVAVGKRSGRHSTAQRFINKRLVDAARRHAVVVRLKGGDPMLFGRAQEEIVASGKHAGIRIRDRARRHGGARRVSAELGVSLTRRGVALAWRSLTPRAARRRAPERMAAAALAADTAAIYMGAGEAADRARAARRRQAAGDAGAVDRERFAARSDRDTSAALRGPAKPSRRAASAGPSLMLLGEVLPRRGDNGRMAGKAVVLFAHGARDPDWARPFRQLALELAERAARRARRTRLPRSDAAVAAGMRGGALRRWRALAQGGACVFRNWAGT